MGKKKRRKRSESVGGDRGSYRCGSLVCAREQVRQRPRSPTLLSHRDAPFPVIHSSSRQNVDRNFPFRGFEWVTKLKHIRHLAYDLMVFKGIYSWDEIKEDLSDHAWSRPLVRQIKLSEIGHGVMELLKT